jgi:hypothetical protein
MTCRHEHRDSTPTPSLHSRRRIITALASAAVLSARPLVAAPGASADDERFMRLALDEARQGDFPFGTVIVRDGQVLARGRNLGKTHDDPTAHGDKSWAGSHLARPAPFAFAVADAQPKLRSLRPTACLGGRIRTSASR